MSNIAGVRGTWVKYNQDQWLRMKGNRSIDNNEFGRIRCMSNKRIKKYKSKAHGFGLFVCICVGK